MKKYYGVVAGLFVLPALVHAQDILYTFNGSVAYDSFGISVSGAGDVNNDGYADMIVGISQYGRARVFSGANGSILYTFNADSIYDGFGYSVSGAGDVNNDGYADVIIGASDDDNNGADSGSVQILSGVNGSILYTFNGDTAGDRFGYSVSGAGDVNNDGYADVIVGAKGDDNNGTSSGSARILSGANGSILYTFNGDSTGDEFGWSVSGAGDVNNDGYPDVVVGAHYDDNSGSNSGSARILSGANGSILYTFNGDNAGDEFGWSVSGAGDVNNDGYADVIVSAYRDDKDFLRIDSGSAQVLSGANGSILYTFNGDSANDEFGYSVRGAGDVNNDGYADVIVGSRNDDNNGTNSGSARIFSGANGSILYAFNGDNAGDLFGNSVSAAGDVNGDGYADVIVGAYGDDNYGNSSGSARVFSGAALWTDADSDGLNDNVDVDDDNDGMPDTWESIYGLNVANNADALADADNDGINNLAEYQAGSHPIYPNIDGCQSIRNDFSNDGYSEVTYTEIYPSGYYFVHSYGPTAPATTSGGMDPNFAYACSGDFSGDGKADMLFFKPLNGGTLIWQDANKSTATYPGTMSSGFDVVAVCDTNGNGSDDIVWYNKTTGGTNIWLGGVKANVSYPGAQNTAFRLAACDDFNNDGFDDLFWRNEATGGNEVWLSANKSTRWYPGKYNDAAWKIVGSGDINNNGQADLIWFRVANGGTQVWEGGLKTAVSYPGTGVAGFLPAAIGDYNGNGTADLLWRNDSTNGSIIWSSVNKSTITYPAKPYGGYRARR